MASQPSLSPATDPATNHNHENEKADEEEQAAPLHNDQAATHCIPFILARLRLHQPPNPETHRPFFIGLNGVQGAGKTTLVRALADTLRDVAHLETLVCSIDDLYLKHEDQAELARSHALNPLVQHRGEPGTHDMQLARDFFAALAAGTPVSVPQYDKSAHNGRGDRVPSSNWQRVNQPDQARVQVVILEGWSVGFRALAPDEVERKRAASRALATGLAATTTTLWRHRLEDLLFVNERLRDYDVLTDAFDAFIHIDALDTAYVYAWRLEQEAALRRDKGAGMTDEQVISFVDGYYPAYELFTDPLRAGVFKQHDDAKKGGQLRLVVGRDRKVIEAIII